MPQTAEQERPREKRVYLQRPGKQEEVARYVTKSCQKLLGLKPPTWLKGLLGFVIVAVLAAVLSVFFINLRTAKTAITLNTLFGSQNSESDSLTGRSRSPDESSDRNSPLETALQTVR